MTELVSIHESPEVIGSLIDHIHEGVYFVGLDRTIRYWSKGAERLSGRSAADVVGRRCDELLMHTDGHGNSACGGACPLMLCSAGRCEGGERVWLNHADGHRVPIRVTAHPVFDLAGNYAGRLESFADTGAEGALPGSVAELDLVDPLSGAGTQGFASWTLRQWWAEWHSHGARFGVLLFDVDDLRRVNDARGRAAGDALLRMLADTLTGSLRGSDFLARWHEDAFLAAVRCPRPGELHVAAQRSMRWVGRLRMPWRGSLLRATLSAGAASCDECNSPEALFELAEWRMEQARQLGCDTVLGPWTELDAECQAA